MIEAKVLAVLIEALCIVESGGRADEVNRESGAVGILQIRVCVVEELNRIAGREKWKLSDRSNPRKSKAMAMEYFIEKEEEGMSVVDLAMMWRHGPTGMYVLKDVDYLERLQNLMEAEVMGWK
jgi:hypothetical protein